MALSLVSTKPVSGEASVVIKANTNEVFDFIAENFFDNYPSWAPEIVELESLDGDRVCVGAKGRQVRNDGDALVESIFEITEFKPPSAFVLQGVSTPYKQTYIITENQGQDQETKLTFKFDLLDMDFFMLPFEKLIRVAIEDGAESTVSRIKELLTQSTEIATE